MPLRTQNQNSRMNPYDEEAMMQEVIYLHSLWHKGPPPPNRNPNSSPFQHPNTFPITNTYQRPNAIPNPRTRPTYNPSRNLHLTINKPLAKRKSPRKQNAWNLEHCYSEGRPDRPRFQTAAPDPGPEWPVKSPPALTPSSGWPQPRKCSEQVARPHSAGEQAKLTTMKIQIDLLRTCCKFFRESARHGSDEDDEYVEVDDGDEDYLMEQGAINESEYFDFFLNMFVGNRELRSYYESNYEVGDFICLVCGGIGERIGRKFNDCLGLLKHSTSISKTKRRKAHRAFAQVICKVLAWDVDKLPFIVPKGEPLSRSLGDLKETQGLGLSGVSDSEWPCIQPAEKSSSPSALGWPALKPLISSATREISAEEKARIAVVQLQQKVLEACQIFFVKKTCSSDSEDDEDEADEEEEEYDFMDENGYKESEEYKFFLRIFEENSELRSYYLNNHESGEFCCLVCGGIGKKVWKRFKDCSGLLQHSTTITKTKKKQAHRAFARVICEVLGWDFDRLPTIVPKGYTFGQALAPVRQETRE